MKNSIIKKALALVCALAMVFTLCACSSNGSDNGSGDSAKVYKVGICNYVDDASLNQTRRRTSSLSSRPSVRKRALPSR